jgi:hypothetical protein
MPVNSEFISTQRIGDRFIEDYDRGMHVSMMAKVIGDDYYVTVNGVAPGFFSDDFRRKELQCQQMPGIHVIFASPDDRITGFSMPCFVVRRESVEFAESRWHGASPLKYQIPANGSSAVNVSNWGTHIFDPPAAGHSAYEEQRVAHPYDITYMISAISAGRNATREAQLMLRHLMRAFPPKEGPGIWVVDSIGEGATYETFAEGPVTLKELLDVDDRQAGFSLTVRVQALLDLRDPYDTTPATSMGYNEHNGLP